jgi:pimeloyl-ACP methyl ester carboxylesterase
MGQRRDLFLMPVLALLAAPVLALNGPLDGLCTTKWIGEGEEEQYVLICAPSPVWEGDWVVYAHGYVAPQEEPALPIDELTVNGMFLPELLLPMGYGFATTSYSKNGFVIEQAVNDINALVDDLPRPPLTKVFAVGASEGGLVTTMLVEQFPDTYAGGLSLCGPVAGSTYQIQYVGDFRVVFDYYFPLIFDFGAVDIPEGAYDLWEGYYTPRIALTMLFRPRATNKLFRITGAARDPAKPVATGIETALTLLFYNISGTNDLIETAGGIVYDNQTVWYGTRRNWLLNLLVERVEGEDHAQEYLRWFYEPTGDLEIPLVAIHNTLDPAVPYEHETIYWDRATPGQFTLIPVEGYGHCNFTTGEIMGAFTELVLRAAQNP